MRAQLNHGKGRCQGAARLLVKPIQAVIELGASPDVLTKSLNAVHHANRHGAIDDFIAVAFPAMRMGRNCMLAGHEIELIGSEASLAAYLELEGPSSLKRRGMLVDAEVEETSMESGMSGAAYVRDRACEKHTPGWIRRSQARAERRGKPVGKKVRVRDHDRASLTLQYGQISMDVREIAGEIGDEPLMVSTYGFSGPSNPAILPVIPAHVVEDDDAA